MTETTCHQYAEVSVYEDLKTGVKTILLRVFSNLELLAVYNLDYIGVHEKTTTSTTWNVLEKEND